jgi:hypothetical protein
MRFARYGAFCRFRVPLRSGDHPELFKACSDGQLPSDGRYIVSSFLKPGGINFKGLRWFPTWKK